MSDRDPSKRDVEHGIDDLRGPDPDRGELWGRFITGEYPEDPAERHPLINRWLSDAIDEFGNVYYGFDAPEWASETHESDLPPEQREAYRHGDPEPDETETGANR